MDVEHRGVIETFSCRCHNVKINAFDVATVQDDFQGILVGEKGVNITHHYLTLRIRDRARQLKDSDKKLTQHLVLWCLACKTRVYRVAQDVLPGSEAREGPIMPADDWVGQETLCSKSGWVEVYRGLEGCLVGEETINKHLRSTEYSETFTISISSAEAIPTALTPTVGDGKDRSTSIPSQILPALPSLFPPPPFSPSHPVFASLSALACDKSADLRRRAEEEVQYFIRSRLQVIEQQESQLRREVEAIWRGYREGWTELIGRVNEERRRTPQSSLSSSNVKSGTPTSIRDFSPILDFRPELSQETLNTSPNSIRTDKSHSLAIDGMVSASVSLGSRGETASNAFRRNMDTSFDTASSVRWAQGEEEMRKRFSVESNRQERARKRTSKNLGIAASDSEVQTSLKGDENAGHRIDESKVPENLVGSPSGQTTGQSNRDMPQKSKRRVTFDVNTEPNGHRRYQHETKENTSALVELFDLDDVTSSETNISDSLQSSLRAHTVVRTPSYKLRQNLRSVSSDYTQSASLPSTFAIPKGPVKDRTSKVDDLPTSANLITPFPLLSASMPYQKVVEGGNNGSHVSVSRDELLVPSEVPHSLSNHHALGYTTGSLGSPVTATVTSAGEEELKILLAASAPSHRHAWREGGKSWDIFHQRFRKPKRVTGVIAEETEDSLSDIENESDESVGHDSSEGWHNPSRFASSLPVQIRPLLNYQPTLEPKTSLADKQGVLVPPLTTKSQSPVAIRKAVYAERDRSRAIDPGPTLDFSEETELEDDDAHLIINEADRGRRHALSILQARSVVPEAGMWRSMAS